MNNKTFNIYCDESTHLENDGHPYMLYGYVSIAYDQLKACKEYIKNLRIKHDYYDEFKWVNVHDKTYKVYKELVDYFFMTDMVFKVVIVDKSKLRDSKDACSFQDLYTKTYFQLLHHDISLEHIYNIYFDTKDTCSQQKIRLLKDALKWNASIRNFQFVRSHESVFVQLADVLIGAINYKLRIDKKEIEGKVIAKRKIVDLIESHKPISLPESMSSSKNPSMFFITLK